MLKLALVDEADCFVKIDIVRKKHQDYLQIDTILAKSPYSFEEYVKQLESYDLIGIHRVIWVDECDAGDSCFAKFKERLGDKLYGIGKLGDTHQVCSDALGGFADMVGTSIIQNKELISEGDKVHLIVNSNVIRENQVAKELTLIGNDVAAFTLSDEKGNDKKYFQYSDLVKIS